MTNTPSDIPHYQLLPASAGRAFNRCNLPTDLLGAGAFQHHPIPLQIDGVLEMHRDLFHILDREPEPSHRAQHFLNYMRVTFRLAHPEDAGATPKSRTKADYLRLLRGWFFDAEAREAAVLKGWVESRFGLVPRFHRGRLSDELSPPWRYYEAERAEGLTGTNALEAQLDLVFAYCQYEVSRCFAPKLTLFRGVNGLEDFEILARPSRTEASVLLNNLNSFSSDRDVAGTFGDFILTAQIPAEKIFCYSELLPGKLRGEHEVMVIGGVYDVHLSTL